MSDSFVFGLIFGVGCLIIREFYFINKDAAIFCGIFLFIKACRALLSIMKG